MIRIIPADLDDRRVIDLVTLHMTLARAQSPPCSAHALDIDGLRTPDIRLWAIWDGDALLAIGALKRLSSDHGEVKSMHVVEAARGRGLGAQMIRHIIEAARNSGMTRLSLETGVQDYFIAARKLYEDWGFVPCDPFDTYRLDPNSVFMSLDLTGWSLKGRA